MKTLLLAVTVLVVCVGLASAQISAPIIFTVESQFVVGNTTFPAGTYRISPTSDDGSVVEITGAKGSPSIMIEVDPIETNNPYTRTQVIFNKYADHLVLKEAMIEGTTSGIMTETSLAERKHRKDHGKPVRVPKPAKT
jgi:hypothetical protein